MLFTSLLGRRRGGARRTQTNGLRRTRVLRPQLEVLEDRLPPGDVVLGGLLASVFTGPSLVDWDSLSSPPESSPNAGLTAKHRPSRPSAWSVLEDDRIALSPPFAPSPSPSEQPPRRDSAPGGSVTPGHANPGWDALSLLSASEQRPRVSALAGSPGFNTTPSVGNHNFPGGGEHPAPSRAADPTGTAPVAAGTHGGPSPAAPPLGNSDQPASEPAAAPAMLAAVGRGGHGSSDAEAAVHARFDLADLRGGPFPSNRFTVADPTQLTGLRVNLPLPDAAARPSDHADVQVLNTLDGFNLQPRLSIPFDGPIDVHSVNSRTVFLVSIGDATDRHDRGGQVVGINQVVWDVATNTLHVESDELLDQHTRYALIVTGGVRDTAGNPVGASEAFRRFRHEVRGEYKQELLDAVQAVRQLGIREQDIVTASVFTTQSATAILEKIRDQIHAATPAPADFLLGPGGTRTVFALDEVSGITFGQQTRVTGSLTDFRVPIEFLNVIPGAVGTVAFGKYLSPDYETAEQFIPAVGTRTGMPAVQGVNEIYFNLFLPSGPTPAGGWPVALFGHGAGNNKNNLPQFVAASMAAQGIATLAINAVGSGFGPLGTLTVGRTVGEPVTFSAGGRGIDQDGDHAIGVGEGLSAAVPRTIIATRDGLRQTVADLMQLVRVVEVGMDVDGDGSRELDPSRIYYFGQSLGGMYGTIFLGVEPSVRAGVPTVTGGSSIEWRRLSATGIRRSSVGGSLDVRTPSLINPPGITTLGGIPIPAGPHFNENVPLRDGHPYAVILGDGTSYEIRSPMINTVAGAMTIQEVFEHTEWVSLSGDPLAYAPHLRKAPLPGVPAKSVIYLFAKGDQTVPNPTTTALLRAGELADRATYYRNDLAFAEDPTVPRDPHAFMTNINSTNPLVAAIALGAQEQIATFFASDGAVVIHPEPSRFFETPIVGPLPEGLNYIP